MVATRKEEGRSKGNDNEQVLNVAKANDLQLPQDIPSTSSGETETVRNNVASPKAKKTGRASRSPSRTVRGRKPQSVERTPRAAVKSPKSPGRKATPTRVPSKPRNTRSRSRSASRARKASIERSSEKRIVRAISIPGRGRIKEILPRSFVNKDFLLECGLDIFKFSFTVASLLALILCPYHAFKYIKENNGKVPSKISVFPDLPRDDNYLISLAKWTLYMTVHTSLAFVPIKSNKLSIILATSNFALLQYLADPYKFLTDFVYLMSDGAILIALFVSTALYLKGFLKSTFQLSDKILFGFFYGFKNNDTFFGKKWEDIFYQFTVFLMTLINFQYFFKSYEKDFPGILTVVCVMQLFYILEKLLFTNSKDMLQLDCGFVANVMYLLKPITLALPLYTAFYLTKKETLYSIKEYAFVAALVWTLGFYIHCTSKYDPPRRMQSRSAKGFIGKLSFIWNRIVLTPWFGPALVELSIAGIVYPLSGLSLQATAVSIAATNALPFIYYY